MIQVNILKKKSEPSFLAQWSRAENKDDIMDASRKEASFISLHNKTQSNWKNTNHW